MKDVEDIIEEIVCIYKKTRLGKENRPLQFKDSSFDFNALTISTRKCFVYSKTAGLVESEKLAIPSARDSFFWLHITDPSTEDLANLSKNFQIHETTITEIKEKNTQEKIDVYRNYVFITLKLQVNKKIREFVHFSIAAFDDLVITISNKQWAGVNNILNFCHVASTVTVLDSTWVFLSAIIEVLQDVGISMDEIERQIDSFSMKHSVRELQSNFFYLHQVSFLKQYIRPKIKILRKFLRTDFVTNSMRTLLKGCIKDFLDVKSLLGEAKRSFERNQDMILGLRDMELAEQSHRMNVMMNRISKATFFFLPIQCVAGLWGMNVRVPWQKEDSGCYFWLLTLSGPVVCFLYFFITERTKSKVKHNLYGSRSV